jgi:hypothetical protein
MKSYIDLSAMNITVPVGWSNNPEHLSGETCDFDIPRNVSENIAKLVGCNNTMVFLKGTNESNFGHYIFRGLDFYNPSTCLFFLATSPKVDDIYYINVDATMLEFSEMLGKGAKLELKGLVEWLDRVEVELFSEFSRNLRKGLDV